VKVWVATSSIFTMALPFASCPVITLRTLSAMAHTLRWSLIDTRQWIRSSSGG
jgi:hypothetical protein